MMKENSNNKFFILLLLFAIIVICVMAYFIFKLNIEKTSALENISENSQMKINAITYEELTEEIYNQMPKNQYFIIQDKMQNNDGTLTLKGRIYEKVELTSISANEYNSLKSSGKISIFGESFSIAGYDDVVPGYALENSNGFGFYVIDEDKLLDSSDDEFLKDGDKYKLGDFNDSVFLKGTDKYYKITFDENIDFVNNMADTTQKVSLSDFSTDKDYNFINNSYIYDFEFNNGKVSKISFWHLSQWLSM